MPSSPGGDEAKLSVKFVAKSFLAGGAAGMCAKTAVAPLDRVKILLQAQSRQYRHLGVLAALRQVVREEGAAALFRGNGAQMARIFPYGALQFTTFEVLKQLLPGLGVHGLRKEAHAMKFVAGGLAGLVAVAATFPLDTIRARLAFQVAGELRYSGILHTGRTIVKESGVAGLYRGLSPTLVGIVPYAGLSFYCFELLKVTVLERVAWARAPSGTAGEVALSVPAKLLCGGLAGALSQTVSYPLDVTRRRMQLGLAGSMRQVLATTYREEGVARGLYRGMSVNYMRAVPMTAVSFSVYEWTKQLMGLQTGLKIST
jgi:solute carrier family 25 protein 16